MKFEQRDVRILREALAGIANRGHQTLTPIAIEGLRRFAFAVHTYCEHVEEVFVEAENKNACLDCGRRTEPKNSVAPKFPLPVIERRK